MRLLSFLLVITCVGFMGVTFTAPNAHAQVVVNVGPAPNCPYGYYDYPPYPCAPPGYYGPEWFVNGIFIGAGPWFHGPKNFHGRVNNHFAPEHGYKGPFPKAGERAQAGRRPDEAHFKGNESRDGRGHVMNAKGGGEQHGEQKR